MTKEEYISFVRNVKRLYTNFNCEAGDSPRPSERIQLYVDQTYSMYQNYDAKLVNAALQQYVVDNVKTGFPPQPAQIIGLIYEIKNKISDEQREDELDAWALVKKAIRNSAYNSIDEFNKLPQLVQYALGAPGTLREWALSPNDTVDTVAQAQFYKTYRAAKQREKENMKLPSSVRQGLPELKPRSCGTIAVDTIKLIESRASSPMPDSARKKLEEMRMMWA